MGNKRMKRLIRMVNLPPKSSVWLYPVWSGEAELKAGRDRLRGHGQATVAYDLACRTGFDGTVKGGMRLLTDTVAVFGVGYDKGDGWRLYETKELAFRLGLEAAIRKLRDVKGVTAVTLMHDVELDDAQMIGEAMVSGNFRFIPPEEGRKPKHPAPVKLYLWCEQQSHSIRKALDVGSTIAYYQNVGRQWVTMTHKHLTPPRYVELIDREAEALGNIEVERLDHQWFVDNGCALILSVAQGSVHGVHGRVLSYMGAGKGGLTVRIVGKALTFDIGGAALKPGEGQVDMERDMAGSASAVAILLAAAALGLKVNVIVYLAACENMIGPDITVCGDEIYSPYLGMTVKVRNTDAEGRRTLIEMMKRAQNDAKALPHQLLVDIATLTGAMVMASPHFPGIFSNRRGLRDEVERVGIQAGEPVQVMSFCHRQRVALKKVSGHAMFADITGGRVGGAISAAEFLAHVVEQRAPWAHCDIAPDMELDDAEKSGEASLVCTMVRLLQQRNLGTILNAA